MSETPLNNNFWADLPDSVSQTITIPVGAEGMRMFDQVLLDEYIRYSEDPNVQGVVLNRGRRYGRQAGDAAMAIGIAQLSNQDVSETLRQYQETGVWFHNAATSMAGIPPQRITRRDLIKKYPRTPEEAFHDNRDESTYLFPELFCSGADETGKSIRRPEEVEN